MEDNLTMKIPCTTCNRINDYGVVDNAVKEWRSKMREIIMYCNQCGVACKFVGVNTDDLKLVKFTEKELNNLKRKNIDAYLDLISTEKYMIKSCRDRDERNRNRRKNK